MICKPAVYWLPWLAIPLILAGGWTLFRARKVAASGDRVGAIGQRAAGIALIGVALWFVAGALNDFSSGACPTPDWLGSAVHVMRTRVGSGNLQQLVMSGLILGFGILMVASGAFLASNWQGGAERLAHYYERTIPGWAWGRRAGVSPGVVRLGGGFVGVMGLAWCAAGIANILVLRTP
jgi:hypothetical protein